MPRAVKILNAKKSLARGRESIRKRAWSAAYSHLSAAARAVPLEPKDLEQLAMAAHLSGRDAESLKILARAHHGFLLQGAKRRAARCAFWLGFISLNNSDRAQASGWLARSRRLLAGEKDCVERGYLLLPAGRMSIEAGDAVEACKAFAQAAVIAERFGDRDLAAIAMNGHGRSLIRQGELAQGLTYLDEAMVAVTSGEVSPIIAGAIYCSVLESCHETFDMRRAQEWTGALNAWCESQPELVPYRGHCQLQHSEILQLRGAWPDALVEAEQARDRLSLPPPKPALGAAYYRVAEIFRLSGKFAEAEAAYRQSNRSERRPLPGFAQLRLAQGKVAAASAAIRQIADEATAISDRACLLEPLTEIMIAANDIVSARKAAVELSQIAKRNPAPLLAASAHRANGAVLLAQGDARGACAELRQSWKLWSELDAPYEAARTRVLISLACMKLGDADGAQLELAAAREVFASLGAAPDLVRLEEIGRAEETRQSGPLSAREIEVLKLVASGRTNRQIAQALFISEKTVARHMSNIFVKLDLPSRAAATAYAFQHHLA